MPEQNNIQNTLLVDPNEAFIDLLKIPDKPSKLQRLGGSPSRWIGLILLLLIWVPSIVHYKHTWNTMSFGTPNKNATYQKSPSITITKDTWSRAVVVGDRQNIRVISVEPPVRRLVMINDDPSRVLPLVGLASDVDLGSNVKTLRWMLAPDEVVSSATITYELY